MWIRISNKILNNRWAFIIILGLITAFMGYRTSKIKLSYDFVRVLPVTDSSYINYENFKKLFGEDASVMVVGFKDNRFFDAEVFNDWYQLADEIRKKDGIQAVVSEANIYNVGFSDSLDRFEFFPLVNKASNSQQEVDSIKKIIDNLPFYDGLIYNKENGTTLMGIRFTKSELNTKHRIDLVNEIKIQADLFAEKHHIDIHYSGMPYIRTKIMEKVSVEMIYFLALALFVTAVILWLFFRSFTAVISSMIVVTIGVVWSLGTIQLFGYNISILSSLIPAIIIIIGIPNCIFLINKYHVEYGKSKDKMKALEKMVEDIGILLFLANITTAIGFAVLYFTHSILLTEFGVVAAIDVMATYLLTLILIPIILSFLPPPSLRHMYHLDRKRINKVLAKVDYLVHNKRKEIYTAVAVATIISLFGMSRINIMGYIIDDLPQNDAIYTDLRFFEDNFHGILPFEIFIDTKKENGVFADGAKTLYKIKTLEKKMAQYPELSKPVSIVDAIKFSYQAYKGGNPKYYVLPPPAELQKLADYSSGIKGNQDYIKGFLDTSRQYTRVSCQIADIGSKEIKKLQNSLKLVADSIFSPNDYNVMLTGHSTMFLKSNDYLLENLIESLIIEIILIALVGIALFRSVRIIILSKLPCLIPLVITAGIMGFCGIRFKPSTILIFSMAFGISSDGTIYFLTKYRQELSEHKKTASQAISAAIRETGFSMIYTAIILLAGFFIFALSSFGGTQALGILISITLFVAMLTNLILLPAILLSLAEYSDGKS